MKGATSDAGLATRPLSIKDIRIGETAEVLGFDRAEKNYRRRLLSMGLTKGSLFTLKKIAPMGDPVEIEVRGYRLSLRRTEAEVMRIRKIR